MNRPTLDRTLRVAVVAASVLLQILIPAAADALPQNPERWLEYRSDNFTFYSNASERRTRRIAQDLETLHRILGSLSTLRVNSPLPTRVVVFRKDDDFEPYKFLVGGKPANISGFFQGADHANYIAINAGSDAGVEEIVYHEYIHYYLHNNFRQLPVWVDEGLAELYSTFDTDSKYANVGKPVGRHLEWLQNHPLIPLAELLASGHAFAAPDEAMRQGSFYAQSWVLVHYLLVGNPDRKPQAIRFLELLDGGAPRDEAFRTAFGSDYRDLERELAAYARKPAFQYYRYPISELQAGDVDVRPLAAAALLTRLGDLLASQLELRPEAEEHYRAALALDEDDVPALTGMGRFAERTSRLDEARALYRRAAAGDADDFVALYHYGTSLLWDGGTDNAEGRAQLERCIRVKPEFGPCWASLSFAYTFESEPGELAVKVARRAHELFPSRTDVAYNLLLLATRTGDRDTAQSLADGFFANLPDPEPRVRAQRTLMEMDVQAVYELSDGGDHDGAKRLLADLERRDAAIPGLGMADHLQRLKDAILTKATTPPARAPLWHPDATPRRPAPADPPAAERRTAAPKGDSMADLRARLNRLLAEQRLTEALAWLRERRTAAEHAEDRSWIDRKIGQIEHARAYNRFIDQYNEAVDLVNAKAYVQAVALLEDLAANAPDEDQAADARGLLERVKSRMER